MSTKNISGLKVLFGKEYNKWSWKNKQLSYTTPVYISKKIAELVKRVYGSDINNTKEQNTEKIKVWDMFAGLGVDLIQLGLAGFEAHGTELSDEIYTLLLKNINSFNLESEVFTYHTDCLEKIAEDRNSRIVGDKDIVYFDPPWGDTFNSSKIFDFSHVKLDNGIYIIDLLREIYFNYTKNIVIKSPLKCNTFEKLDFIEIERIIIFRKHHLKFILVK